MLFAERGTYIARITKGGHMVNVVCALKVRLGWVVVIWNTRVICMLTLPIVRRAM